MKEFVEEFQKQTDEQVKSLPNNEKLKVYKKCIEQLNVLLNQLKISMQKYEQILDLKKIYMAKVNALTDQNEV